MPGKLIIKDVIWEAIWLLWHARGRFFEALILPGLLLISLELAWYSYDYDSGSSISRLLYYLYLVLYYSIYSIIAIICHRLVLLGPGGVPRFGFNSWSKIETVFLLVLLGMTWGAWLLFGYMYKEISFMQKDFIILFATYSWVIAIVYYILFTRLSVIYPSIAIGDGASIKRAFSLTKGYGFKLFVLVGIIPILFNKVSSWLYDSEIGLVLYIIGFYASILLIVLEVILLSLAYKHIKLNREISADQSAN